MKCSEGLTKYETIILVSLSVNSLFKFVYMKTNIYFFATIFLIFSCQDPIEDPPMEEPEVKEDPDCAAFDEKSLEMITGIRFFDENGSPIGQAGNPNITEDSPIQVYPNPNNGVIAISKQNNIDYDLFIFPCVKDTMCSDIDFNEGVFEYSIDSLLALDSTSIDISTQNLQLQFQSNFEAGYYKLVFYSAGEDVIIENIYFDSSKSGNEMIDFLNGEF